MGNHPEGFKMIQKNEQEQKNRNKEEIATPSSCVNLQHKENGYNITEGSTTFVNRITGFNTKLSELSEDLESEMFYKISDRIYVVPQLWNSRSLIQSNRVNANEFSKMVNTRFDSIYMLWRLSSDMEIARKFKNVEIFPEPENNVGDALLIAKSIKAWLDMNDKHIAIIEKRGSDNKMGFLVAAAYKHYYPKEDLTKFINSSRFLNAFTISKPSVLTRFVDLYDSLYTSSLFSTKFDQLLLTQIIISYENSNLHPNQQLALRLYENGKEIYNMTTPSSRIYHDEFFMIFFINNIEIRDDIKIVLITKEKVEKKIIELDFSTYSYSHGIYRFEGKDIELGLFNQFKTVSMDVVFNANPEIKHSCPYSVRNNIIENIKNLSEHYFRNYSVESLKSLVEDGYNRIISRFCLQRGMNVPETKQYVSDMASMGNKNLLMRSFSQVNNKIIQEHVDIPKTYSGILNIEVDKPKEEEKNIEDIFKIEYFSSSHIYSLDTLEEIVDAVEVPSPLNTTQPRRRLPPKKLNVSQIDRPAMFARRPLHFSTLSAPDTSIFQDLKDLKVSFNTEKFESWFCDTEIKNSPKKIIGTGKRSNIEGKRLFLVQLAMKSLEKRGHQLKNISTIVKNNHACLEKEDLGNIEKLFLDEVELKGFLKLGLEALDETEIQMMNLSLDVTLINTVKLLKYERSFSEEPILINSILVEYKTILGGLMTNKSLKEILAISLEVINAISYKYTVNKKKTKSFKMNTLTLLSEYRGKDKEQSLLVFLVGSLDDKSRVLSDLEKFKGIERIQNEELSDIKKRINKYIIGHKECINMLPSIPDEGEVKDYLHKLLGYTYEYLKVLRNMYLEVVILSNDVRQKFCDADESSVTTILKDFTIFFDQIRSIIGQESLI